MNLTSVAFDPVNKSLIPQDLKSLPRPPRRIMEVIKKGSNTQDPGKKWSLDFCLSPKRFNPRTGSTSQLGSMSFERTNLDPEPFDPNARAVGTGKMVDIPSSLAFRSIGYKSEALTGFSEMGIPFNDSFGVIPNDQLGRVVSGDDLVTPLKGMYCAGWVKRGPTGVIASTMADAFQTANSIAEDWWSHASFLNSGDSKALGWEGVKDEAEKTGLRRISWQDWKKIDIEERKRGSVRGKEREKFTNVNEMLAVLD